MPRKWDEDADTLADKLLHLASDLDARYFVTPSPTGLTVTIVIPGRVTTETVMNILKQVAGAAATIKAVVNNVWASYNDVYRVTVIQVDLLVS